MMKDTKDNIIDSDITLYLSDRGSDLSGTGSLKSPWRTENKALDYLKDKIITENAHVIIQDIEPDMIHDGSILSNFRHPCGNRITMQGKLDIEKLKYKMWNPIAGFKRGKL